MNQLNNNSGYSTLGVLMSIGIFGVVMHIATSQVLNIEKKTRVNDNRADLNDLRYLIHTNLDCAETTNQSYCGFDSYAVPVTTYSGEDKVLTAIDGTTFHIYEVKASCTGIGIDFVYRNKKDSSAGNWAHLFDEVPIVCPTILDVEDPGPPPVQPPNELPPPTTPPEIPPTGLACGHFDADTFEGDNKLLKHVHAYDDKYGTDRIVYYGVDEAPGNLALEAGGAIDANSVFRIALANAGASPGATLSINQQYYSASLGVPDPNQLYSISNYGGNVMQLTELAAIYQFASICDAKIACSEPSDVKKDPVYRNQAFRVQLISATDNSLLWEGVTYWHDKDCVLGSDIQDVDKGKGKKKKSKSK